jgi:hypothetical protein
MNLIHDEYHIESVGTQTKNGYWAVHVVITWREGTKENSRRIGPFERFDTQNDAESWGLKAAIDWVDSRETRSS